MQKINPFLWFEDQAEEAANLYVSIFGPRDDSGNTKIVKVTRYGAEGARAAGRPEGSVMTVDFQLFGQDFVGLNGGPDFRFTEAVSFVVNCDDQAEVDEYWEKLSAGGEQGPCGWLKDRFGLSWQVVPTILGEMLADEDPQRAERAMAAMLQMKKIEIDELQKAYDG